MQHRLWFMHGTSHWLGMNVHDVGGPVSIVPGVVSRTSREFTSGRTRWTRRPVVGNRKTGTDSKPAVRPAFEKYKGDRRPHRGLTCGLTAELGAKWMTEALPRKLSDARRLYFEGAVQSE